MSLVEKTGEQASGESFDLHEKALMTLSRSVSQKASYIRE